MIKNLRSRSLLGAGAAAALLTLAACGGIADDAPDDASVEDFCAAFLTTEGSAEDVAKEMADTGTPEDISDEQRNGFEVYVDALNDEGDKDNSGVSSVEVPADDKSDGEAFITYAGEKCAEAAVPDAEVPTDAPS